jgi:hypothetical protein
VNNTDVAGCQRPSRLATWQLVRPSSQQAAHRPALAAVRAALAGMPRSRVGPTTPDVCSAEVAVVVPLRGTAKGYGPGKLNLQTSAVSYEGVADKDKLALQCLPR